MSELKCPICGGAMIAGGICHYNLDCPIHDQNVPTEVLELLDRTRKALDYATTMLTRISVSPETMLEPEKIVPQLAGQAIEQIESITKAKEQQ